QLGNFHSSFRSSASEILWNFNSPQGASTFIDREWYGSILMPSASLTNRSAINGGVYVGGDFNQYADVRQVGYSGPPVVYPADAPEVGELPGADKAPELASVPEPSTITVFALGGLILA